MLNTTFRTVNEILNEKRGISPEMAVRLARFFGTSEELWLNLSGPVRPVQGEGEETG